MEPKDRFHMVYICMLMAGVGFLFPWNSYITAIDYFILLYKHDFPQVTEAIPMTYLITTFLSATFNMSTVELFPLHGRITFGYIMFCISLLFVPLLDIGIGNCTVNTHVSFYLTLLSIVVVALGSGGRPHCRQYQCSLCSMSLTVAHTHVHSAAVNLLWSGGDAPSTVSPGCHDWGECSRTDCLHQQDHHKSSL